MARRQIAVRFTFKQPQDSDSPGFPRAAAVAMPPPISGSSRRPAPRDVFWDYLRSESEVTVTANVPGPRLPEANDECDKFVRTKFGPALERRLNGVSEQSQRPSIVDQLSDDLPKLSVTVNWTSYESLTIGVLIGGANVALDWIGEHRDVFEHILMGLAAEALDEAVAVPVSPYLTTEVNVRVGRPRPVAPTQPARSEPESGTKYPYTALVVKELAKVWTILLGLALLFLVAYN